MVSPAQPNCSKITVNNTFNFHLGCRNKNQRTWLASSSPFWPILDIHQKIQLPRVREKLPVTPGPPRLAIRPLVCLVHPQPNTTIPSSMNQSVQIPQPDLPASILPTWSSPSLLKPSRMPQLWSALELTTRLPSYTLRPSLLSDNTACFITKGALPPYPSQVSHTLLLYSEILDKYLTWLKGQTQNEERVKRDFSTHTHTHSPVTSPPLLSRTYFWPQAASINSPRSHTLWTRRVLSLWGLKCPHSAGKYRCHYPDT